MRDTSRRTPGLRRHKPSGQGVVTLNSKDYYLGPGPLANRRRTCAKPTTALPPNGWRTADAYPTLAPTRPPRPSTKLSCRSGVGPNNIPPCRRDADE